MRRTARPAGERRYTTVAGDKGPIFRGCGISRQREIVKIICDVDTHPNNNIETWSETTYLPEVTCTEYSQALDYDQEFELMQS